MGAVPIKKAKSKRTKAQIAPTCCRGVAILPQHSISHGTPDMGHPVFDCSRCRLSILFHYIDRAPMALVTAEKSAEVLHVSTSRLRHLCKLYLGLSFQQYVIRLRLERAGQLVCRDGKTIGEVADALDIRHLSHFLRDFKRFFGATPTQLRQRCSKEAVTASEARD